MEVEKRSIDQSGWMVSKKISKEEFFLNCSQLGFVKKVTDVRIDSSKPWFLNKPDMFPMHTDDASVNYVAWWCLESDPLYGEILLIDSRPIINKISQELGLLETLESIKITNISSGLSYKLIKRKVDGGYTMYYAPWALDRKSLSGAQGAAFSILSALIDGEKNKIRIKLENGDALFINNSFMLHGREAIPSCSSRHLIRVYVSI